jgi:hypothetical protein
MQRTAQSPAKAGVLKRAGWTAAGDDSTPASMNTARRTITSAAAIIMAGSPETGFQTANTGA